MSGQVTDAEHDDTTFKNDRLSMPPFARLTFFTLSGSLMTFFLGAMNGGKRTSYQFLAENAHRLPRTHQGWYFYHKTKNYRVMYGGIKSGFLYARKTMVWTVFYTAAEAGLDHVRGTIDAGNSVLAASSTAAAFCWRNGFSRNLTKRTMKMAAWTGLGVGLLQDGLIYGRGGRIWYLEKLLPPNNQHRQEQAAE